MFLFLFVFGFSQPLDTEEEQTLAVKKKAKKLRGKQQKVKKLSVSSSSVRDSGRSSVVYVGRIPHGFYEEQMRGNTSFSFLSCFPFVFLFEWK